LHGGGGDFRETRSYRISLTRVNEVSAAKSSKL
jgi:hypothetical protein